MKTYFLHSESQIKKYLKLKHFSHYIILHKSTWLYFFPRWEVMFYNDEDINSHLIFLVKDLLQTEINIEIKTIHTQKPSEKHYVVQIDTNQNGLLYGRFGQNQKFLSLFFSRALSQKFRTKYEVEFQIASSSPFTNNPKKYDKRENRFSQWKPFKSSTSIWNKAKEYEAKCLTSQETITIDNLTSTERLFFHRFFRNHNKIRCFSTGDKQNRVINLKFTQ